MIYASPVIMSYASWKLHQMEVNIKPNSLNHNMGFIGESLQSLSEMFLHKPIKILNFTG